MSRVCDDLEINGKTMIFDGFLDHEDEMEVWSDLGGNDFRTFIDKKQARAIISHLQQVFSL